MDYTMSLWLSFYELALAFLPAPGDWAVDYESPYLQPSKEGRSDGGWSRGQSSICFPMWSTDYFLVCSLWLLPNLLLGGSFLFFFFVFVFVFVFVCLLPQRLCPWFDLICSSQGTAVKLLSFASLVHCPLGILCCGLHEGEHAALFTVIFVFFCMLVLVTFSLSLSVLVRVWIGDIFTFFFLWLSQLALEMDTLSLSITVRGWAQCQLCLCPLVSVSHSLSLLVWIGPGSSNKC